MSVGYPSGPNVTRGPYKREAKKVTLREQEGVFLHSALYSSVFINFFFFGTISPYYFYSEEKNEDIPALRKPIC